MVLERMRDFCWYSTRDYEGLQKFLYLIKVFRPALPQQLGTEYYRKNSSWHLNPRSCPCDIEFIEYFEKNGVEDKVLFHFGTGSHTSLVLKIKSSISRTILELQLPSLNIGRTSVPVLKNVDL